MLHSGVRGRRPLVARLLAFVSTLSSLKGRLRSWAAVLTTVLSVQTLVQVVVLLAGIVVVRLLSLPQFALYTIVTAAQNTAFILADSGSNHALISRAGPVAHDPLALRRVAAAGLSLQRHLEIAALAVSIPMLLFLLRRQGESAAACALSVLATALSLHGNVSLTVYSTIMNLQLRPVSAQFLALVGGSLRLCLVLLAVLFAPNYLVVLFAVSGTYLVQAAVGRRMAFEGNPPIADTIADDRRALLSMVSGRWLNAVYFAFQPQLTIFLVGIFGDANSIASVGALGRLGLIFSSISGVASSIAVPRFARYSDPRLIRRRFAQIVGLLVLIGGAVTCVCLALPRMVLAVIGPHYSSLGRELAILAVCSAVGLLNSVIYVLNASRNWVRGIWVAVPVTLATQVILALSLDLGSVSGAILFQGLSWAPTLLINVYMSLRGLREASA